MKSAATAGWPAKVRRRHGTLVPIARVDCGCRPALQRHVDAAVPKTVNLPAVATLDDVRAIYVAA